MCVDSKCVKVNEDISDSEQPINTENSSISHNNSRPNNYTCNDLDRIQTDNVMFKRNQVVGVVLAGVSEIIFILQNNI